MYFCIRSDGYSPGYSAGAQTSRWWNHRLVFGLGPCVVWKMRNTFPVKHGVSTQHRGGVLIHLKPFRVMRTVEERAGPTFLLTHDSCGGAGWRARIAKDSRISFSSSLSSLYRDHRVPFANVKCESSVLLHTFPEAVCWIKVCARSKVYQCITWIKMHPSAYVPKMSIWTCSILHCQSGRLRCIILIFLNFLFLYLLFVFLSSSTTCSSPGSRGSGPTIFFDHILFCTSFYWVT